MGRISAQKLAELAPCSLEQLRRLEGLGLLQPDDDGSFPSSDVHVVRLMAAFEEAGISLEDVARGVAAGELSFPLGLFLPEPVARSPPTSDARPSSCGVSAASLASRRPPTTAYGRRTPRCCRSS